MLTDLLHAEAPYVPLQLSHDIPTLDRSFEEISSRKVMSDIICEQPRGSKDLNETVMKEWLQPAEGEKVKPKSRIAIVGQAQVGKTRLLKTLLEDVREKYDYIFYVSLQYINCSDEMNILQFLVKDSSAMRWINHRTDFDFQIFKRVVERLHGSKEEKICIILDDLEKSNFHEKEYVYDKGIFETTQAGYLVSNILRHWFRKGQIILLLRPWQYFQLNLDFSLHSFSVVYVQGINHEGQKHLRGDTIPKCQTNRCKLSNACMGFVTAEHKKETCSLCKSCYLSNCHHEIQSLCYVPINCMLLVDQYLLQQQQQQQAFLSLPPIVVSVVILIQELLLAYQKSNMSLKWEFLKEVGRFAWEQYAERVYVFDESDLIAANLSNEVLNIFFTCKLGNSSFSCEFNKDLVFFFSHVLLQELLAASWLLSLSADDFKAELQKYKNSFLDKSFAVLCEFMSTICTDSFLKKYHNSLFSNIKLENGLYLQKFLGKLGN